MVYIDNRLISLNSNYGTQLNGTMLSNINFNFKGLLKKEDNIVMSTISLVNAQIPCSFYIINSTNNVIQIKNSSNQTYSFTVPIGNYNANTLVTQLLAIIALPSITLSSITIGSATGILTFNFSAQVTILAVSTISRILGMNATNIISTVVGVLTLPFPLNLLGAKRLSIKSNFLSINSYHSFNLGSTTTLMTIPIDQPSFNMLSFLNQSDLNTYVLTCKTIDTIDIQIFDEYNNYFDFNNADWSISLNLGILRKETTEDSGDLITKLKEHNLRPQTVDEAIKEITSTKPPELSQDEKDLNLLEKNI